VKYTSNIDMIVDDYKLEKKTREVEGFAYNINGSQVIFNQDGGLKSRGHPYGASGIAQLVSLCNVLKKGELGLAVAYGGPDATAIILEGC